jgi:hypothetical protein
VNTFLIQFIRYSPAAGRMFSAEYSITADDFSDAADRAKLMMRCFDDAAPQFEHGIVSIIDFGARPQGTNTFEHAWQMLTDLVSDDAE